MGESGGFNGDNNNVNLAVQGSFSRLLSCIDDIHRTTYNNSSSIHQLSPLFSSNTPNMLCFGDINLPCYTTNGNINNINVNNSTYSNSNNNSNISSASSCGNDITMFTNVNELKRRSGSGQESGSGSGQKNGRKRNNAEIMGPTLVVHAKAKREKLGERISALHQLVCPYGKTDTASVLHEAIGYIRFLHEQVKVLSSPYLVCLPLSTSPRHALPEKSAPTTEKAYDNDTTNCLRSRGLCLVPVDFITDIGLTNGGDFWSYATRPKP